MTCYDDAKRAYVECTKAANYHARVLQALDYYEHGWILRIVYMRFVRRIIRRLSPLIPSLPRKRKVLMG